MTEREHLLSLANRIRRLSPDRRDPEQFHIEKSELAAELRRLANTIEPDAQRKKQFAGIRL